MKYVLNDERQLTSHGFYLLNSGGDFVRFRDNPMMLYQHDDDKPIGLWENLRIEGSELLADPRFNENDSTTQEAMDKIENGFLRGLSVGMYIREMEERIDPTTGRCAPYVTAWELVEVSIVSIPSNAKSLIRLKVLDKEHKEVLDVEKLIKLSIKKDEKMALKLSAKARTALKIAEDAGDEAITAAVDCMVDNSVKLSARNTELEAQIVAHNTKQATDLVELAVKDGRIDATKKKDFITLAMSNYDLAKNTLESIPVKMSLSGSVKVTGTVDERVQWGYSDWKRNDPQGLAELKATDPEKYSQICRTTKK